MKRGPKTPDGKRLPLCKRGPKLAPRTIHHLDLWRNFYGLPYGRAIDCLMNFALDNPITFRLSLKGAREALKKPINTETK